MPRLIALDTETTGLDPRFEELFEIAAIDMDTSEEKVWHLRPTDATVRQMHPKAAEVNRYHERIEEQGWWWDDRATALDEMRDWLDGAHLVGAVPDFDARFLTALYHGEGQEAPRWHYHLIDIEAMCVGYLARDGKLAHRPDFAPALPWESDDLSRLVGVEPPSDEDRHTAFGDARWVAALYDAITKP